MARRAGAAACGACGLGRARGHLERAVAQLEAARAMAWGLWADDIRQLTEQRLGIASCWMSGAEIRDTGGRWGGIGGPVAAVAAGVTALRSGPRR